jgi:hypothetical protein
MLLVGNDNIGFYNLIASCYEVKVSILDEEEDTTRVFTKREDFWISQGEILHQYQLANFLSELASDCVAYKIETSKRDENIPSLLESYG